MPIRSVTTRTFPYVRTRDLYQEYYRSSLRSSCEANRIAYIERSNAYVDAPLRALRSVRYSYRLRKLLERRWFVSLVDGLARLLTRRSPGNASVTAGIYEVQLTTGDRLTLCIDADDRGDIYDDLARTCDLYLKSNFWPTRTYPANVLPIPNLNPLIGRDLPYFRNARSTPKTIDLFAFFRIWGGADELEGIEHNLALIESLAATPCSKYLCAYLVAGDIPALGKRLESQGIAWTDKPMQPRDLWQRAAEARLNIVRLGMHECSPWRMIDILAMGGCPVIDYGPRTCWPTPLVEGLHFLSLQTAPGAPPSTRIPGNIASWLAAPGLVDGIARNTAAYFDQHLAPTALGKHILAQVESSRTSRARMPDDLSVPSRLARKPA